MGARASVLLLLPLVSCGGTADEQQTPSCVEIQATTIFRLRAGASSGWFTDTYEAGYEPAVADGWSSLAMKLRTDGVGVFDLSREALDTDGCERCVYVTYAGSGDHFQLALAKSGTLELSFLDVDRGEASGTIRDATFVHLGEVALHSFRGEHPDGQCFRIAEASFDTRAETIAPCDHQAECPNGRLQACDPASQSCVAAPCSVDSPECADGGVCQIQQPLFGVGACHAPCAPFTSGACPGGMDCIPIDYVGERGICRAPSANPPPTYASCSPGHATTGCAPGEVCTTDAVYWHDARCYPQCDYFGVDPGCGPDSRCRLVFHDQNEVDTSWLCGVGDCHMGGYCEAEWDGAGTLYGDACESGQAHWPCEGSDRRLGVCLERADGLRCRAHCRVGGTPCAGGLRCEQVVVAAGEPGERSIAGVGVCVP